MERKTQLNVWYIIFALLVIVLFQNWWVASRQVEVIPYSQFEELLKNNEIEEVRIRQDTLEGKLKKPIDGRERFVTTRVDPQLAERLSKYDVKFTGVVESTFLRDP